MGNTNGQVTGITVEISKTGEHRFMVRGAKIRVGFGIMYIVGIDIGSDTCCCATLFYVLIGYKEKLVGECTVKTFYIVNKYVNKVLFVGNAAWNDGLNDHLFAIINISVKIKISPVILIN